MTFTLGQAPENLRVVLVAGADFVSQMRRKDGTPWPTAQLYLEFAREGGATQWQADFSTDTATWNIDQAEVDGLLALKPRTVRLWYVEGQYRLLWAQGDLDIRRSS